MRLRQKRQAVWVVVDLLRGLLKRSQQGSDQNLFGSPRLWRDELERKACPVVRCAPRERQWGN